MATVTIEVKNGTETWKIEQIKSLDILETIEYFKQCLKDMPVKKIEKQYAKKDYTKNMILK